MIIQDLLDLDAGQPSAEKRQNLFPYASCILALICKRIVRCFNSILAYIGRVCQIQFDLPKEHSLEHIYARLDTTWNIKLPFQQQKRSFSGRIFLNFFQIFISTLRMHKRNNTHQHMQLFWAPLSNSTSLNELPDKLESTSIASSTTDRFLHQRKTIVCDILWFLEQ